MEVNPLLLLCEYLMIEPAKRKVIEGLIYHQRVQISDQVEDPEVLLQWLSAHPLILRTGHEVYAAPLFHSYQLGAAGIEIRLGDNIMYSELRRLLKELPIGELHLPYHFAARLVAFWMLQGGKQLSFTLKSLRELLGVKPDNYKSFVQIDRILSRVRAACEHAGITMQYRKEPEKYARLIINDMSRTQDE